MREILNFLKKEIPDTDLRTRLIDTFPYREFRPDNRMFVMADASLGIVYRINAFQHEPMTAENLEELGRQLEKLIDLPAKCTVQFLYLQDYMLDSEIAEHLQLAQEPECKVAALLRKGRIEILEKSENRPFVRSCYMAIRFFPGSKLVDMVNLIPESMVDGIGRGYREFEKRVGEFEEILARLENLSAFDVERISGEILRKIVRFTLVGKSDERLAPINPSVPFQDQILFESIEADPAGLLGKRFSRTVSFLVPSSHFAGAPMTFLRLGFPYLLSMRLTFPGKAKVGKFLAIKEWCTKNSFSAGAQRQFAEIQLTKKRLADGDPCVHLSWGITVFGTSEAEVNERASQVRGLVAENFDCNAIVENEIGFDLLRGSLPLMFEPKGEWGTQRHIPLHRSEVASFLPVFDSFRGTKLPLQVLKSRDGNLVPFSAVEGETSQHAVFLGDTGSGKSAFMNSVLNGIKCLNPEPIVFVIDFNTSQAMNVRYYGGELNAFNANQPCAASVFRGVYDEKKVLVLTNWICEAIRLTSPTFVIESEHREAIAQAIRQAVRKSAAAAGLKFTDGDLVEFDLQAPICLNMDMIATELSYLPAKEGFERFRQSIEDLLVKLRVFYGDGLYSAYFTPTNVVAFSKRFYVYDLAAIAEDPVLLNLTVASIFEEIRQVKLLPENQEREIWAVLDEIAVLGRGSDLLTQYFVNKAETSRKDGFWIFGATNRPQNFVKIPVCLALMQVAEHMCFLPMSAENVKLLAAGSESLTTADQENIASLRIQKDSHSEVYYVGKSKNVKGVMRYQQTPHERWQSPTNAKAGREALRALEKFGNDAASAIEYLVEKFPKGVS